MSSPDKHDDENEIEEVFAKKCLLTVPHIGTNTITQRKGECTTKKRPVKLVKEDQCVVRCETDES